MRYLLYLLLFIQCGCISTNKPASIRSHKIEKNGKKVDYDYYNKLAKQYRGTGLPDGERSSAKTNMVEYERNLNIQLKKYFVSVTRKKSQIYLKFPHTIIFDTTVSEPAIAPEAYFGVLSDFVYVLLNHRSTFIEVRGYGKYWLQAQKRANAFAGYLCLRSVDPRRVTAAGYENRFEEFIEVVLTPL